MKRFIIYVLSLMLLLNVAGCAKKEENKAEESSLKNYSELSNGTYSCDEHIYKYRFEIAEGYLMPQKTVLLYILAIFLRYHLSRHGKPQA